jgi:hypothetical protein
VNPSPSTGHALSDEAPHRQGPPVHDPTREKHFTSVYKGQYAPLIGYALRRVPEPEAEYEVGE